MSTSATRKLYQDHLEPILLVQAPWSCHFLIRLTL